MQIEGSPAVQFTERLKPWQRVGLTILACCGTTLLATPLLDHLDLANIVMLFLLTVLLIAVSLGSVFMGANTYIGNGPNFMVKTIAESAGVKMPSFFGYMVYSICILIPLFVLTGILFT